jgi:peptidoglycan/xylan/chitin deacetylase (PgdA/CDA1 family)
MTRGGRRGLLRGGTPVLLYHAVGERPLGPRDDRYRVVPARFDAHLEAIAASGRRVVPLAEVWKGGASPATTLTFDDGRESDHRLVFPRLLARGFSADFFVNPGTVGRPGFLTWAEAREMSDAGMGLQSHGYDHGTLWGLDRAALRRQLGDSRRAIEDATGRRVEFLAAPFGHLTGAIVRAALEEGYRAVCTSLSWPARPGRRTLGRVAVYGETSADELRRVLEGRVLPYARRSLRSALVYPAKRVMVALRPSSLATAPAEGPA